MKRYKLLKDLPFAKAGEIFKRRTFKSKDGLGDYDYFEICKLKHGEVNETAFGIKRNEFIDNLDDWFEEIEEPKRFWSIDYLKNEIRENNPIFYYESTIKNLKSTGNYFTTKREAEKHLEWLKARAVLIEDAKGFKPDWDDDDQIKFYVYYDFYHRELLCVPIRRIKETEIFFETEKDAENSIKTHEKEWKIYLGVD